MKDNSGRVMAVRLAMVMVVLGMSVLGPVPLAAGNGGPPEVIGVTPGIGATLVPLETDIEISFDKAVTTTTSAFDLQCPVGSVITTTNVTGAAPATDLTLDPTADLPPGTACRMVVVADQVVYAGAFPMTENYTWTFTTAIPVGSTRIHDVQGLAHLSPLSGTVVSGVFGVVTVVRGNGFFMQDPTPDSDPGTSEGIFVFTSSAPPGVSVGVSVSVQGRVAEFRPGGSGGTNNLTTTQIGRGGEPAVYNVLATGVPTPAPSLIGQGGRLPPDMVIDAGITGTVESPTAPFSPTVHGIDFYESLEGMLVALENPVVSGPTSDFGEIPVISLASGGPRTPRGSLLIADGYADFNPERLLIDDAIVSAEPQVSVGDILSSTVVGVMDYSFSNFKLLNTQPMTATAGNLQRETVGFTATAAVELTVAAFNVENLSPSDPAAKFDSLAEQIVNRMGAPDLIALEEVQDNNGTLTQTVVAADQTLQRLITAISAAGGPLYTYRQIDPVEGQDGGAPGGNIRNVFLFRTDRGLAFVDRAGGTATAATAVVTGTTGAPQLLYSPGRIDPTNAAFNASRKPLAGEFTFRGQTVFVIANHFNSKGGDQPLFGRFQPPTRTTEVQRLQQAAVVNGFVDSILALDPGANIIVLGDLNDFEFSPVLEAVKGGVLNNLVDRLPKPERYTYVFEGNAQMLDHLLVSGALLMRTTGFDIVHLNAEFSDQISDHDPSVARFNFAPPALYLPIISLER
jgi:hypothetical protein